MLGIFSLGVNEVEQNPFARVQNVVTTYVARMSIFVLVGAGD